MKKHVLEFIQDCKNNPEMLILEARTLTKTMARRIGKRKLRAAEGAFESCPPECNPTIWKNNCDHLKALAETF